MHQVTHAGTGDGAAKWETRGALSSAVPPPPVSMSCSSRQTAWTYWHAPTLPAFEAACVQTARVYNPDWHIVVLDAPKALALVGAHMLPPGFLSMKEARHQSDIVRIAVLAMCGGTWFDSSTIFMQPQTLTTLYDEMARSQSQMVAYHDSSNSSFVPNWFVMAAAGAPLVRQWHAVMLAYFATRLSTDWFIMRHPLFDRIPPDKAAELWRLGHPAYLFGSLAFLAVQEFSEWRNGRWQQQVLLKVPGRPTDPYTNRTMDLGSILYRGSCPDYWNASSIPSHVRRSDAGVSCIRNSLYAAPNRPGHMDLGPIRVRAVSSSMLFLKLNHFDKPAYLPAYDNFSLSAVPNGSLLGQLLRGDHSDGGGMRAEALRFW